MSTGNRRRRRASGATGRTAWARPQRRRPAGADGAAPPRAHRRGDGRARVWTASSRCSASPSTEPDTAPTARSGAARCCSPTTRATSAWLTCGTCRWPAATSSVLRPYRMALSHLWAAGVAWDPRPAAGRGVPGRRATRPGAPAQTGPGLRADVEHGQAVRRGVVARRRPAGGGLRGAGRDRAGGPVPRRRLRRSALHFEIDADGVSRR